MNMALLNTTHILHKHVTNDLGRMIAAKGSVAKSKLKYINQEREYTLREVVTTPQLCGIVKVRHHITRRLW